MNITSTIFKNALLLSKIEVSIKRHGRIDAR